MQQASTFDIRKYVVALVIVIVITAIGGRYFQNASFAQNSTRVDLALVLAIDCSFSVNANEFNLQMQGLARALSSEEVIDAITSGPNGAIAITVVEWSGVNDQKIAVPWVILDNPSVIRKIANNIASAPRLASGKTSISAIIDFAVQQLAVAPVTASRHVIDISADGVNNDGALPERSRALALAAGITINGLAIINEVDALDSYFEKYIVGGPGYFVLVANDYKSYEQAIKKKLLREIRGAPLS